MSGAALLRAAALTGFLAGTLVCPRAALGDAWESVESSAPMSSESLAPMPSQTVVYSEAGFGCQDTWLIQMEEAAAGDEAQASVAVRNDSGRTVAFGLTGATEASSVASLLQGRACWNGAVLWEGAVGDLAATTPVSDAEVLGRPQDLEALDVASSSGTAGSVRDAGATGIELGARGPDEGAVPEPGAPGIELGALESGETAVLSLEVRLDPAVSNAMAGREASFSLVLTANPVWDDPGPRSVEGQPGHLAQTGAPWLVAGAELLGMGCALGAWCVRPRSPGVRGL